MMMVMMVMMRMIMPLLGSAVKVKAGQFVEKMSFEEWHSNCSDSVHVVLHMWSSAQVCPGDKVVVGYWVNSRKTTF